MKILFNPNDWLGRHPVACLGLVMLLTLVAESL